MQLIQLKASPGVMARHGVSSPALAFLPDIIVMVAIFCVSAYAAWNDWWTWTRPPVVFQAIAAIGGIAAGKWFLLRRGYRTVTDRVALACVWVLVVYAGLALGIVFLRPGYSRSFLLVSFALLLAWQFIEAFTQPGAKPLRFAAVPAGMVDKLVQVPGLQLIMLSEPVVDSTFDGLVVDMHAQLPREWQRFVAESAAMGLPVYHAALVYEAATARVFLDYAHSGWLQELLDGTQRYLPIKRVFDVLCVLLSLPLTLPLCLVIALLIRLDSDGPVLFWQDRVGQGGTVFKMVKFRSMRVDAEKNGAQFARVDDDRVTRVGRFLRKYRLDELPQLWNVLKGEMSLIGPRPEQVEFARRFEEQIPFYQWRHRVKPGITGWAQVHQGYAAGVEDTLEKLAYDLYYVKHLSLWLDLNIIIKTVGTILTGFGAR